MVVSAMGRYPDAYATDTLLSLGNDHISKEESARLVSIGEQLSALTISSELQEMGIDSYSIPFAMQELSQMIRMITQECWI